MGLVLRWLIAAAALFVAAKLVPGITVEGNSWAAFAVMALVLGLVNAVVKPLLKLLTGPLIVLTLGLFLLVINALMLMLASWLSQALGFGFHVSGFLPAFWGALIVSVVTMVLSVFVKDEKKKE